MRGRETSSPAKHRVVPTRRRTRSMRPVPQLIDDQETTMPEPEKSVTKTPELKLDSPRTTESTGSVPPQTPEMNKNSVEAPSVGTPSTPLNIEDEKILFKTPLPTPRLKKAKSALKTRLVLAEQKYK